MPLFRTTHLSRARVVASAITITLLLAHSPSSAAEESTPKDLELVTIGIFDGGPEWGGGAEIVAFDAASQRLFAANINGTLDIVNLSNPARPKRIQTIDMVATYGWGNAKGVASHHGLVAVALDGRPKTDPGRVAFFDAATLKLLGNVEVGARPDSLTFSPDGKYVVTTNEGTPDSYGLANSADSEGSVSVIDVSITKPSFKPQARIADFRAYNGREDELRRQGIRIFGPNASAAQDLEPESVAVSKDSKTAYVTLQENNAIAIVDLASAKVTAIKPLGIKDHNFSGMGLDPSDQDGADGGPKIQIKPYPVFGMYQPDGIASYTVNGKRYIVTANEGDSRADWPGYSDETRVKDHCTKGLDPAVFGEEAKNLIKNSQLGRLRVTTDPFGGNINTGKNAEGLCTALYAFGARSFSIWNENIEQVFDSGDDFEQKTKALPNVRFNASHDNNKLDGRSPAKGPEPEGVTIGQIGKKFFAFIGLERVSGIMVYDITNPKAPIFVTYYNDRQGESGDRGPEGMVFVPASKSPNGKPLLLVANEVSGTASILQINLSY